MLFETGITALHQLRVKDTARYKEHYTTYTYQVISNLSASSFLPSMYCSKMESFIYSRNIFQHFLFFLFFTVNYQAEVNKYLIIYGKIRYLLT